jgi:uncharacterized protein YbjT (DUF2867 family)
VVVLIFGSTGSAGGSVLRVSLAAPRVSEARVIARRPVDVTHPKLSVRVHSDFQNFAAVADAFAGVDACLYCLGVSATQVPDEPTYRTITHDFALAAAKMLLERSPDAIFHFISGAGARADSRFMWARVKAQTESDLIDLADAICWRPAFIDGENSTNAPRLYQAVRPLARLLSPFKSMYVKGEDIGRAMLQATVEDRACGIVENTEIRSLANRYAASAAATA